MAKVARFRLPLFSLLLSATLFFAGSACAETVVVRRHVTVRDTPSSNGNRIAFPEVGTQLELVDAGLKVGGYYHVRLGDGRTGWVYANYVGRVDPAALTEALTNAPRTMTAHFINVDQGAAALLEFSCGAILIDAGGHGDAAKTHLVSYLNDFFARRPEFNRTLNAVFVTHAHLDHDLNIEQVAVAFTIDGFIYNGVETPRVHNVVARFPSTVAPVPITQDRFLTTGTQGFTNDTIDPLRCTGTDPRIRVLAGHRVHVAGRQHEDLANPNNHSLVIRVDFDAASFLFTGDLMVPSIEALVERYRGSGTLRAGVYAVGHHGADNGTTDQLLTEVSPQIAIISSGDPNPAFHSMSAFDHGHPRRSTLNLLDGHITRGRTPAGNIAVFDAEETPSRDRAESKAVYSTASDGDIDVVASSNGTFQVVTHPPQP